VGVHDAGAAIARQFFAQTDLPFPTISEGTDLPPSILADRAQLHAAKVTTCAVD
jgi:hypothetical protein